MILNIKQLPNSLGSKCASKEAHFFYTVNYLQKSPVTNIFVTGRCFKFIYFINDAINTDIIKNNKEKISSIKRNHQTSLYLLLIAIKEV